MTFLLLFAALSALEHPVVEPVSKQRFAPTLDTAGKPLALTGADLRQVTGITVYAIAHYADPAADTAQEDPSARQRHWIAQPAAKAFVLKGTRSVPARGIRWSWENSLERVQYRGPNAAGFVKAFERGFEKNSTLVLRATQGNRTKSSRYLRFGRGICRPMRRAAF